MINITAVTRFDNDVVNNLPMKLRIGSPSRGKTENVEGNVRYPARYGGDVIGIRKMWRFGIRPWVALIVLPLCLLAGGVRAVAPADPRPIVTDVRVGQHGAMTRFVLDLDRGVRAEIFTLADPTASSSTCPRWLALPAQPFRPPLGFWQDPLLPVQAGTTRVVIDLGLPDIAAAAILPAVPRRRSAGGRSVGGNPKLPQDGPDGGGGAAVRR
jgi:hypothetical protein